MPLLPASVALIGSDSAATLIQGTQSTSPPKTQHLRGLSPTKEAMLRPVKGIDGFGLTPMQEGASLKKEPKGLLEGGLQSRPRIRGWSLLFY